jgi:Protein of unknown function (DUF3014)
MTSPDDVPLYTEPQQPVPPSDKTPVWVWVAVVAAVVVIPLLAYRYFRPAPATPAAPVKAEQAAHATQQDIAPVPAEPVSVPPLSDSDGFVRDLLRGLSSRPELAVWLATPDLVRNAAAVVDNIAEGEAPAKHLQGFAPKQPFRTAGSGSALVTDPRSYARFDALADAVDSIDAAGAVKAYRNMRPLFEEAYRDLGHPEGKFDLALQRAISRLLATPDVPPDVRLESHVESYHYANETYESLSGAQKQLLRMGPRNVRLVKDKLREILRALGFEERG